MGANRKIYWRLFAVALRLSACTFGGGVAIVPLMRRKFVEELHWMEEEEMLDFISIAQASPGAIAVNTSILVGYHIAGALGALVTAAGTVLPPLVIISVISCFYAVIRHNVLIHIMMAGMLAGIVAIICDVVWTLGADAIRQRGLFATIMILAAFVAVYFLHVNMIWILFACAAAGMIDARLRNRGGAMKS